MLASVLAYSVFPLAVGLWSGGAAPFLFNGAWRLGIAAGFLLFLVLFHPGLVISSASWRLVARRLWDWRLGAVVVAYFDLAFFAWASALVDLTLVVLAAQASPLFLILFLGSRLGRVSPGVVPWGWGSLVLGLVCLAGFGFVLLAQGADVGGAVAGLGWLGLLGLLLALLSALVAALNGFGFRWGRDLADDLAESMGGGKGLSLFGVVMAGLLANLVAAPLSLAFGWGLAESLSGRHFLFALALGGAAYPVAGILWRWANVLSLDPGINALAYLRPVFSLLWLAPFGLVLVSRTDYLVLGTVLIILANLLLHLGGSSLSHRGGMLVVAAGGLLAYLQGGSPFVG